MVNSPIPINTLVTYALIFFIVCMIGVYVFTNNNPTMPMMVGIIFDYGIIPFSLFLAIGKFENIKTDEQWDSFFKDTKKVFTYWGIIITIGYFILFLFG